MINQDIFNEKHIYFGINVADQDEAFHFIASKFVENGVSEKEKKCYNGLKEREFEGTTGFNDGIAIPHARIKHIHRAGIFVFSFTNPVEWNSIDGSKVKIAIALSVPLDANGDQHITILSSIARKLVNKSFRTALTEATTPSALYELINKVEIK